MEADSNAGSFLSMFDFNLDDFLDGFKPKGKQVAADGLRNDFVHTGIYDLDVLIAHSMDLVDQMKQIGKK